MWITKQQVVRDADILLCLLQSAPVLTQKEARRQRVDLKKRLAFLRSKHNRVRRAG